MLLGMMLILVLTEAAEENPVALPNGPNCEDHLGLKSVGETECQEVARSLGYKGILRVGSWSWAPFGCHAGHPGEWASLYFNKQSGQTGRSIYVTFCYQQTAEMAMAEILIVKTILKSSRTDLNQLAERTDDAMDSFKAIAQSIFNGEVTTDDAINSVLDFNVDTLKNLLKEGNSLIDKAQADYAKIGKSLAKIEDNLNKYKQFVDIIITDETRAVEKHDKANTAFVASRATLYSSCATSTTVCILTDIFLTFGACSAINAGTCVGLIATMEGTIAAVKANLEALNGKAEKAQETVEKVLEGHTALITYFVSERNALSHLDASLDNADLSLNQSRMLFFNNIPTLRNSYMESLDNLKQAARDYIDQPELDF